jgi:anti-sigma regulatory factor (Ser/Thr protein kinase)
MLGKGDSRWGGWWRRGARTPPPARAPLQFRVERERSAIARLNDTVERTLQAQIPEGALRALQIALDELLTNVVMHAAQAAGPIEVEIAHEPDALATTISYLADEFDPTSWRPVERDVTVANSRIGGHGIALVRSLMDEFRYAYSDGRNVVRLRKRC